MKCLDTFPFGGPTPARVSRVGTLCISMLAASTVSLFAESKYRIDIDSGDAGEMLLELSLQTERSIVFNPQEVEEITTAAVKGDMLPSQALAHMLDGTGLTFDEDVETGAFAVVRLETNLTELSGGNPTVPTNADPNQRGKNKVKKKNPRLNSFFKGLLSLAVASAPQVAAQDDENEEEDQIYSLSPFVVDASGDTGYVATHTLAGSRLNTRLADTPASISVFTRELIDDLAITDTFDAVEYALNTANDFEETTDVQTGNFLAGDDIRVRIRGLPNSIKARNFFRWNIRSDSYNTERIDFSRGPNSVLFGRSKAAGIINTSTKRAQFRDFNTVTARFDDQEQVRLALDLNRVLIEDKLAVRLNLLSDDRETWQDPSSFESKRGHIASTWKILESENAATTLRAEFEISETDQIRVRPWGVFDGFSVWEENGSVLDGEARGSRPAGTGTVWNNAVLLYTQNGPTAGSLVDWEDMARSNGSTSLSNGTGIGGKASFDFDQFPEDKAVWGPGSLMDQDYETFSAYLEQRFGKLNLELAYISITRDNFNTRPINWNSPIRVDVNEQLPDGSPNPNAGKFYVEDQARYNDSHDFREGFRATAAYELDFSESEASWLGRHHFAVMFQNEQQEGKNIAFREVNLTPINTSLRNRRNWITRRTYLDFDTPGGDTFHLDYRDNPVPTQSITLYNNGNAPVEGTVTPGMYQHNYSRSRSEFDTLLFGLQSSFWENRVIVTYGLRNDEVDTWGQTRLIAPSGERVGSQLSDGPTSFQEGDTSSYGAVFHATPSVSFFFNHSDTFDIQSGRDLGDNLIPNMDAETDDFGIRMSLLDGKLVFTATAFDTIGNDQINLNKGNVRSLIRNLLESDALIDDPAAQAVDMSITDENVRDTVDSASDGYEFELVGNLTDQWRISANYSITDSVTTDRAPRTVAFVRENESVWLAVPGDTPTTDSDKNFAEKIQEIEDALLFETNQNGFRQFGDSKYRANITTNYDFASDSTLKGFSVGGSLRWRSGPDISRFLGDDGTVSSTYSRGDDTSVDLRLAYRTKIRNDTMGWRIQLNIQNALDDDDILITRTDVDGTPVRYRFKDPRKFILTNTLEF